MRKTIHELLPRTLLCSGVFAALLPAAAHAAEEREEGLELRALGGIGWLDESAPQLTGAGPGSASNDVGFMSGAALGWRRGPWLLETELAYRTNDIGGTTLPGLAGAEGGDFSSLAIAANVLYHADLFGSPRVTSYVGAGVVWFEEIDIDFGTPAGERSFSDSGAGFQLLAGARYELDPNWSLFLEARWLDGGDLSLDGEGAAAGTVDVEYQRTEALVGIGYRF